MVEYELVIHDEDAFKALKWLGSESNGIEERALRRIGEGSVSWVQKNKLSGQVLKRQSGNLALSMQYRMYGPHAIKVGPGMVYGAAHEFGIPLSAGKYIYPRNAKVLRFSYNGATIYASRVRQHVVKRPYVAPGIREYFDSGKAKIEVERVVQQEIDRRNR